MIVCALWNVVVNEMITSTGNVQLKQKKIDIVNGFMWASGLTWLFDFVCYEQIKRRKMLH